jgi:hypothetical protein
MTLLFDIGNTHTHVGLANGRRLVRQMDLRTADWANGRAVAQLLEFVGSLNGPQTARWAHESASDGRARRSARAVRVATGSGAHGVTRPTIPGRFMGSDP